MGKTWDINPHVALWMYKAETTVCSSGQVAHGEQGGGEEPTAKPSGQLPEGCGEDCGNYNTEALEVARFQTPVALAVIRAGRLTADRSKCQGEWRDTGLGHTNRNLLQKHPFTLKQDIILSISW